MQAINDYMMQDHRAIDAIFERAGDAVRAADWPAASTAAGTFLARIGQHIELEEQLLFPAFEESSGMSVGGPTETMRSEHAQMQPLFEQMRAAIGAKHAADYEQAAQALMQILLPHNMKEEQMMYPMLDQALGAQAAAAMVEECRRALAV